MVQFYAPWCLPSKRPSSGRVQGGNCARLEPAWAAAAEALGAEGVAFGRVGCDPDTKENEPLAERYGCLKMYPSIKVFPGGPDSVVDYRGLRPNEWGESDDPAALLTEALRAQLGPPVPRLETAAQAEALLRSAATAGAAALVLLLPPPPPPASFRPGAEALIGTDGALREYARLGGAVLRNDVALASELTQRILAYMDEVEAAKLGGAKPAAHDEDCAADAGAAPGVDLAPASLAEEWFAQLGAERRPSLGPFAIANTTAVFGADFPKSAGRGGGAHLLAILPNSLRSAAEPRFRELPLALNESFEPDAAAAWVKNNALPMVRPIRRNLEELPRPLLLGLCADRASAECAGVLDLLGEAAVRRERRASSAPMAFALGRAAEHSKLAA